MSPRKRNTMTTVHFFKFQKNIFFKFSGFSIFQILQFFLFFKFKNFKIFKNKSFFAEEVPPRQLVELGRPCPPPGQAESTPRLPQSESFKMWLFLAYSQKVGRRVVYHLPKVRCLRLVGRFSLLRRRASGKETPKLVLVLAFPLLVSRTCTGDGCLFPLEPLASDSKP